MFWWGMILYKYFRPYQKQEADSIIIEDLLTRLLIRFTQPSEFDDPFDCLPQVRGYENPNYIEQILLKSEAQFREARHFDQLPIEEKIFQEGILTDIRKKKIEQNTSNAEKLEEIHLNRIKNQLYREVGILCLTKQPDNILMWSHYAEKHTGFVIGFDTQSDFFAKRPNELGEIGELQDVDYSKDRPTIEVPFTQESPDVNIFFTKNEDWRYQAEWRIVLFLKDAHSQPKPGIHLFSIPPNCIREIIFGSHAEKTKEPSIEPTLKLIKDNPDLRDFKIKKAHLSRRNFMLDISDFTA
jgi:hypothetical protein